MCDVVPEKVARAQAAVGEGRPEEARGLHEGRPRLREPRAGAATSTSSTSRRRGAGTCRWPSRPCRAGSTPACEVPSAVTLEECWKLVDTSEATRRHCVILENCCYGWSEMLVLQHGARRRLRRADPRRVRLHPRPALAAVRGPRARGSGGASSTSSGTATSTRPTASGRWRSTWTSTAATASRASSR